MKTILRIVIVILCIIALYYLVVMLARGFTQDEVGLGPAPVGGAIAGLAPIPGSTAS